MLCLIMDLLLIFYAPNDLFYTQTTSKCYVVSSMTEADAARNKTESLSAQSIFNLSCA